MLRGQSVTKERKSYLVRLYLKQEDKNPLYNQQTKARKYKFSNPMERLEGKSARQGGACSWEDKSFLYLTLHKRKITDQGETHFPAEGQSAFPLLQKANRTPNSDDLDSHRKKKSISTAHMGEVVEDGWKEAVPFGTWTICRLADKGRSIRTLEFVGVASLEGRHWGFLEVQSE